MFIILQFTSNILFCPPLAPFAPAALEDIYPVQGELSPKQAHKYNSSLQEAKALAQRVSEETMEQLEQIRQAFIECGRNRDLQWIYKKTTDLRTKIAQMLSALGPEQLIAVALYAKAVAKSDCLASCTCELADRFLPDPSLIEAGVGSYQQLYDEYIATNAYCLAKAWLKSATTALKNGNAQLFSNHVVLSIFHSFKTAAGAARYGKIIQQARASIVHGQARETASAKGPEELRGYDRAIEMKRVRRGRSILTRARQRVLTDLATLDGGTELAIICNTCFRLPNPERVGSELILPFTCPLAKGAFTRLKYHAICHQCFLESVKQSNARQERTLCPYCRSELISGE